MALQTKTFSHGSLTDKSVLNGYLLELTVTEQSVSTVNNTSSVDFVLKLRSGSKNRFEKYGLGASVSLNGKVVGTRDRYEEAQVSLGYNSSVTLVSGSTTVPHNDDGTKSMAVAFSISMATGSYVPGPVSVTGKSMTLTAIPRASTVAAADANIGSVSTVVVGRKSTAYTHTLQFTFGALSGYIAADGQIVAAPEEMTAATVPFAVPESFYGQLPNAPSGKCTILCGTYAGAQKIGEKSAQFTVTADKALCAPEVFISVKDVNDTTIALTGDEAVLVRYASTARCTVEAAAKNAASITALTVEGQPVEGFLDFPDCEQQSFTAVCTDSRGYTTKETASPAAFVPYVPITCNPSAKRTSPTGGDALLTVKGNFYAGSFGAQENALTLSYRIDGGEAVIAQTEIKDNTYSASIPLTGLQYDRSFTLEVTAQDCLQQAVNTVTLQPGIPVFDWGREDFAFHVPVNFEKGAAKGDFPYLPVNEQYPVGAVVLTKSDSSPAAIYGGTWECFKRYYAYYSATFTNSSDPIGFFTPAEDTTAYTFFVTVSGNNLKIRYNIATGTLSDSTHAIGTINFSSLGIAGTLEAKYSTAYCDGGNVIVMIKMENNGLMQAVDIVGADSASGNTAGEMDYIIRDNHVLNTPVDCYFWRRIE